ncbi:hypothetical protein [Streptomyces cavernae]|uniref:hypothetical protein n=1 Tax=Streptomyces cavernae TaxID=2259034 RepID=UPI001EE3BED1|nr:hypothetical protein [Streptomyces cavernae]
MTSRNLRPLVAGCTVAASVLLLASCTSSNDDGKAAASSTPSVPSVSQTAAGPDEKKLTQQAQAALAAVHGGTMVEAGAERVTDGIHTEPSLSEGKTYKISLMCFGSGSAKLVFTPASTGTETKVPCDQSVVQQRITAAKALRIDVDGSKGSTGVIAWQIDTV